MSSFVFDYLVRFRGATSLTYGILDSLPAPKPEALREVIHLAAEVMCQTEPFAELWLAVDGKKTPPPLDGWGIAERRAGIDARVALAYGLSLDQYAAVLCAFTNLDRIQPMLPGEPKSFVTRDLALLSYCQATGIKPADITKLMRSVGVDLPEPRPEYQTLDARVAAARLLGAIPYRPTPKGGRPPTDPALLQEVMDLLSSDPKTASDIAEAIEDEERTVVAVLKQLVRTGEAFAEGRGKTRRYYVIEEGE